MRHVFLLFCLALMGAAAFAQIAPEFQKDQPGSKDHPLLKRMEGSVILRYAQKKFDALQIPLERIVFEYDKQAFNDWKRLVVEGARTTIFYRQPADAGTLECLRSYVNDLKSKGFEVLFEGSSNNAPTGDNNQLDNGYGRFLKQVYTSETNYGLQEYTLPGSEDFRYVALRKAGEGGAGDVYVTAFFGAVADAWKDPEKGLDKGVVVSRIDVIETKPLEDRMVVVKADEMQKQLDSAGRVALYGIYFDFNKADVKPESEATLREIARLLADDPRLKLLVVGHTDSVGGFETNRELSARRAASVTAALVSRHGVSKERLFPFGCSYAAPAASNDTEEGRAKNRRVELVKFN